MWNRLSGFVYPLITLVCSVAAWHLAVVLLKIPGYILPPPMDIANNIVSSFADGTIWPHIGYTLHATIAGYVVGCGLALVCGAVLAESATFEKFVYPLVVALQAMPKVALAPLILVWFGFGIASKIVLVVLICFFPLFVNTIVGLRQADAELIDACRAFSASRWYVFFHVKLPSAAGGIFAGLQIAVSLALIGAVVGELVASQKGLGYMIGAAAASMAVSTMFAGVILLAIMGIAGTEAVRWLHRKVVFWEEGQNPGAQA
jgi:NitT/TauT family transport system permease protein